MVQQQFPSATSHFSPKLKRALMTQSEGVNVQVQPTNQVPQMSNHRVCGVCQSTQLITSPPRRKMVQ